MSQEINLSEFFQRKENIRESLRRQINPHQTKASPDALLYKTKDRDIGRTAAIISPGKVLNSLKTISWNNIESQFFREPDPMNTYIQDPERASKLIKLLNPLNDQMNFDNETPPDVNSVLTYFDKAFKESPVFLNTPESETNELTSFNLDFNKSLIQRKIINATNYKENIQNFAVDFMSLVINNEIEASKLLLQNTVNNSLDEIVSENDILDLEGIIEVYEFAVDKNLIEANEISIPENLTTFRAVQAIKEGKESEAITIFKNTLSENKYAEAKLILNHLNMEKASQATWMEVPELIDQLKAMMEVNLNFEDKLDLALTAQAKNLLNDEDIQSLKTEENRDELNLAAINLFNEISQSNLDESETLEQLKKFIQTNEIDSLFKHMLESGYDDEDFHNALQALDNMGLVDEANKIRQSIKESYEAMDDVLDLDGDWGNTNLEDLDDNNLDLL